MGRIGAAIATPLADVEVAAWPTVEPVPFARRDEGVERLLARGEGWGRAYDCAWFRFRVEVPEEARDRDLAMVLDVGAELLVVDDYGAPRLGLTNARLAFRSSTSGRAR